MANKGMRLLSALLPLAAALAAPAAWAGPSFLVLNPSEPGAPWAARYSQAVLIDVLLHDESGPVAGGQVVVEVILDGEVDGVLLLPQPTDGTGRTTARLTLVNGRHGGATFPAQEPEGELAGQRYRVVATFAGDLDANHPVCNGDAGVLDGGAEGLCPSRAEGELFVTPETVAIELEPGNRVELGEELQLIATLVDPNGDAAVGGTAVDGDEPKPVQGASISFFFDLDGNERPSLDELLGRDDTDANGFATFTFVADPAIFPAGEFEQGLHVQFGGDDRYAVAGAAGRVTIDTGAPDPDRCVIEVATEGELVADGTSRIDLRGILVDNANNILGVDAPDHVVSFTTDLGTILEEGALRDPITGHYQQQMRVPDQEGTANVTIVVDGEPGATLPVFFVGRGCSCASAPRTGALPGAALALVVLGGLVRTRRRS